MIRGCSSTGRAIGLQPIGCEFKSHHFHQKGHMKDKTTPTQVWSQSSDKSTYNFLSAGQSIKSLPPNMYSLGFGLQGLYAEVEECKKEDLITTDNKILDDLTRQTKIFFESGFKYKQLQIPYRRGILLYGPPGSGKSVCIRLLINQIIASGGLVINNTNPSELMRALPYLDKTQSNRHTLVIYEDIDDDIDNYGDGHFLQLFDGISSHTEGLLFIATTNYLEKIPPRIYRPSRFDYLLEVPYPSTAARKAYLLNLATKHKVKISDKMFTVSNGLSFASLKELFISVFLYDADIAKTAKKLLDLQVSNNSED